MNYKASLFEPFLFIDLLMKRYLIIILFFNILCSDIQRLNSSNRIRYDFTNYDDIPSDLDYDHVIKFLPDLTPSPHIKEQHEEMELWNEKLQNFMSKERG